MELITRQQLAEELNVSDSTIIRTVQRENLSYVVVRSSTGKKTNVLDRETADLVRKALRTDVPLDIETPEVSHGRFYVILLFPELSNNIVKLGFSTDLERRLQEHRTLVPMLELLRSWPCKRVWEQTAIDCVTRIGCNQLGPEVFDSANVDGLLSRCDAFFQCLPDLEE